MDFASRKRSLQQTLSNMIHEETESQSQSKSINSTTNGDGGQPQAKAILKPRYTVNLLDTDYQRFVDDLLAEQYAPRCTDFRTVEEIIAFLDHKSVDAETSTARHIAPFNSNLPVLNISKCEAPNPSLPSSINPHVKGAQSKLYSSLLKSSTNDSSPLLCVGSNISTRKSATGTPRRVPKKSEEGRALMAIEKSTGRKQSKNKRGRRSNRPKESLSGDSVLNKEDSIEGVPKMAYKARAPPLLETPTNIPGPTAHHAVPRSHPINNHQDDELRQLNDRIERDMLNLLLNVDESVTVASAPPPVAMPVASNIAAPAPRPVSSQEIFLMNLKTLQQQTSTKEQQQRLADEQQRVMTTLFLRQHFSATKRMGSFGIYLICYKIYFYFLKLLNILKTLQPSRINIQTTIKLQRNHRFRVPLFLPTRLRFRCRDCRVSNRLRQSVISNSKPSTNTALRTSP